MPPACQPLSPARPEPPRGPYRPATACSAAAGRHLYRTMIGEPACDRRRPAVVLDTEGATANGTGAQDATDRKREYPVNRPGLPVGGIHEVAEADWRRGSRDRWRDLVHRQGRHDQVPADAAHVRRVPRGGPP